MSHIIVRISDINALFIVGILIIYLTTYLQAAIHYNINYLSLPIVCLIIILSVIFGGIHFGSLSLRIDNFNETSPNYYHYSFDSKMYDNNNNEEKEEQPEEEQPEEEVYEYEQQDDETEQQEDETEQQEDETEQQDDETEQQEDTQEEEQVNQTKQESQNKLNMQIAISKLKEWADKINTAK